MPTIQCSHVQQSLTFAWKNWPGRKVRLFEMPQTLVTGEPVLWKVYHSTTWICRIKEVSVYYFSNLYSLGISSFGWSKACWKTENRSWSKQTSLYSLHCSCSWPEHFWQGIQPFKLYQVLVGFPFAFYEFESEAVSFSSVILSDTSEIFMAYLRSSNSHPSCPFLVVG